MATVNISERISNFKQENNGAEPTREQLMALLTEVQSKTVANGTRLNLGDLDVQVSEKRAVSVYRLGRFPVTLYAEQWEKLAEHLPAIMDFIAANKTKLTTKAEAKAAAEAAKA